MKIKAFTVIDTNVFVSALISQSGIPYMLLELIRTGNVIPVFDKRMIREYVSVLSYDKFRFDKASVYNMLFAIVKNGILINDVEKTKQEFKDRSDIPFFEVKESADEFDAMLVTGNRKHFPEDAAVVTPKELLNIMRMLDRHVSLDFDYENAVKELTATNLSTSKYTSGDELLSRLFDAEKKEIKLAYFEEQ